MRYNVKLTHCDIDLDCRCLLLNKLLRPFIIADGYHCDTKPRRGDA
eukprot:CAMPEP_0179448836 /NCGR_PEP_ID=MMETSP0799-20121207/32798_1 /TAXON_ID=46947 /ORGANISM="Geminigera cryophila, Strain CCMP2564" /LENGTH=45 /DNA_ID= /DNA_START= /DNA_END= /DNA_ORIENTATION=